MGKWKRLTVRQKAETIAVYYGIDPNKFEVVTIYGSRDGHLERYNRQGGSYRHYNSHHPSKLEAEISIVWGLMDIFVTTPPYAGSEHVKERVKELQAKADKMRAEKEAAEMRLGKTEDSA